MDKQPESKRVVFTKEMKETHTILIPNMLPIQFKLIIAIMENYGYHMKLLETEGNSIVRQGLRNVHNDTCYPALLVIGQLIDAVESGEYDRDKIALLISQTGGGCRASNYIHLLRKALQKNGYDDIPVVSINFSGMESNPGFKLTPRMIQQLAYGVLLGDLIMMLYNQTKPYELTKDDCDRTVERLIEQISAAFRGKTVLRYRTIRQFYDKIIAAFAAIPCSNQPKKRVGIVGEIYVKFSPLGNNQLEKFLLSENCEPVLPGLMDFCLYCVYNTVMDRKLYGYHWGKAKAAQAIYHYLLNKQRDVIQAIAKQGRFRPPEPFDHSRQAASEIIGLGVKMGEGWLLPAEMVELIRSGTNNIVCTQPFGCLPNHIAGKGMVRKVKEKYPEANIVAVDYDPGASRINQENRIKLMLSNAK